MDDHDRGAGLVIDGQLCTDKDSKDGKRTNTEY